MGVERAVPVERAVREVDALRGTLPARQEFRDERFLKNLAGTLLSSAELRGRPAVQAFADDAMAFAGDPRLVQTKLHVNRRVDNEIFSLFDASYFPTLSLDLLTYRTLPTDDRLAERYASPTMPVAIEHRSAGFAARPVVALFPENHIDGRQESDDLIFYFIDKFVERHLRLTRPLMDAVLARDALAQVRAAGPDDVERASAWWVRLHEYHHRQGDMPIPQYLPVKKYKPLAGLEELRADVSSMLVCLHDDGLPEQDALLAYEYVLAERLLRYAVEGVPRPNYDAISSQLLFGYLVEAGGIRLRDGTIHLAPELPAVLAAFLAEVQAIERHIHTEPADQVKQRLLEFTNRYTDFDPRTREYRHIPYFAEIKQRLGV
ncbi:DUF6421 family protein [Actinomadura oligospora]|uniref:DUF6421 family protein n=1 Tax=Actinomadura oligospora TaxID=111804 RepID=UPI0004B235EE|nr:DUF6421 family protein [Actinomadura oligospora]